MALERTSSLFHYTPKMEYLTSILKNGFWPRFSLEDLSWLTDQNKFYLAFPMVSFCDIPLHRIEKHTAFYGSYGIGLRQTWAVENGLSPLTYISHKSVYRNTIRKIAKNFIKKDQTNYTRDFLTLLSNFKPLRGYMQKRGEWRQRYFYEECEWRYVPNVKRGHKYYFLDQEQFENRNTLDSANTLMSEKYRVRINPANIKYLLVSTDNEIPDLVNFIESELDRFTARDIKMLITRISSFESIQDDF